VTATRAPTLAATPPAWPLLLAPPCPPSALIVTKQIPAGTDTVYEPGVFIEANSVVVAAPAGPANNEAATTDNAAIATAPTAEPATRSLTPGTSTLARRPER
jgi:hypothetical protein